MPPPLEERGCGVEMPPMCRSEERECELVAMPLLDDQKSTLEVEEREAKCPLVGGGLKT